MGTNLAALFFPEQCPDADWQIAASPHDEANGACFIVRDHETTALRSPTFTTESEPGRRAAANLITKDEAGRVAVNIATLPDLLRREARLSAARSTAGRLLFPRQ